MNELKQEFKFSVVRNDEDKEAIAVKTDGTGIELVFNAHRSFAIMARKAEILLALNKKIDEMIKVHLETQAAMEKQKLEGR